MRYRMSEGMANIGEVLKEAMERTPRPKEPEQRSVSEHLEPVAIVDDAGVIVMCSYKYKAGDKLYTTPPQRTWVGLTIEDKEEYLALDFGGNRLDAMDWAARKLKEKNT